MKWRKISTAPRKADRILIGWEDSDGAWQTRAAYYQRQRYKGDEYGWTDDAVRSFNYEEIEFYQPTHWLPIPPRP